MKDYLEQEITVGATVAYCYSVSQSKDEMRVAKVVKLTPKRVYLHNGLWVPSPKVLVLNRETLPKANHVIGEEEWKDKP